MLFQKKPIIKLMLLVNKEKKEVTESMLQNCLFE